MRLPILLALLALAGCGGTNDGAAPLLLELQKEFQPGLGLVQTQAALQARGATTTTRSAENCAALVGQARVQTQLQPRGGPCIFGKLPGRRDRLGWHTDIIMQMVFGTDDKLADASFEAIESWR
ncbi:MAG: hypothetical protein ACM3Y9_16775 [Ignavibacteria bacterium]